MKHALLFPGQGSQSVGMLAAHTGPQLIATLNEASDVLGWDVARLMHDGPAEELNRTERTQPALLAAGIALWREWQSRGLPAPAVLAGHSLGEYTALVAANSLDFDDALRLVELRGQLMQAAVPAGTGGMAAVIGLDDDAVERLCASYDGAGVLEPVNYNAPGQVVVAGSATALDWLAANAKPAGARMAMRLPVSVPSHCALMRGAAEKLFEHLQLTEIHEPELPVLHNLDAAARSAPDDIRTALRDQLHQPVRWTQTLKALADDGLTLLVECGPGKVLSGLAKRTVPDIAAVALDDPAGFDIARNALENDAT
jgi:[acyl-carrier-protein] S-malonyltransferase